MSIEISQVLSAVALVAAVLSLVIVVRYLIRRPALVRETKIWLFLGLGPLPIAVALAGNIANYEVTKERRFCGSCHVMLPYTHDAQSQTSPSLAAVHSRTHFFGNQSCYVCHADYGMFGTVTTKLGGLRHVWDFYTQDWEGPDARSPALYKPYSNTVCMQCHPQTGPSAPLAHRVHHDVIVGGEVACASSGCHGPVHPVNKNADPHNATAPDKSAVPLTSSAAESSPATLQNPSPPPSPTP